MRRRWPPATPKSTAIEAAPRIWPALVKGDIKPIGHRQWCVEFCFAAEIIERAQDIRQVVERLLAPVAGASVLAYRAFGLFLLQVRGIEQNDSRQVAC